jgi:hypothetical protein
MEKHKDMRASVIKPICCVVLMLILCVLNFVVAQAQNKPLDYQIWKVFSQDTKGFTIVVVSVNPEHFNREDMTALAAKLNAGYAQKQKLRVGLFDDANTARLFATGRLELPDFNRAQKGLYYLDRTKCKEYIQFLRQGKRQRKEIIRFRCL